MSSEVEELRAEVARLKDELRHAKKPLRRATVDVIARNLGLVPVGGRFGEKIYLLAERVRKL